MATLTSTPPLDFQPCPFIILPGLPSPASPPHLLPHRALVFSPLLLRSHPNGTPPSPLFRLAASLVTRNSRPSNASWSFPHPLFFRGLHCAMIFSLLVFQKHPPRRRCFPASTLFFPFSGKYAPVSPLPPPSVAMSPSPGSPILFFPFPFYSPEVPFILMCTLCHVLPFIRVTLLTSFEFPHPPPPLSFFPPHFLLPLPLFLVAFSLPSLPTPLPLPSVSLTPPILRQYLSAFRPFFYPAKSSPTPPTLRHPLLSPTGPTTCSCRPFNLSIWSRPLSPRTHPSPHHPPFLSSLPFLLASRFFFRS